MPKSFKKIFLLLFIIIFFICFTISIKAKLKNGQTLNTINEKSWNQELIDLNYLILKISSINIINGLSLTKEQVLKLKELSIEIESINRPITELKKSTFDDIKKIKDCYLELIKYLEEKNPIPEKLKNELFLLRTLESEIIKKTILGAEKQGNSGNNCLKCHSTPDYFPTGNINKLQTKEITPEKRKEIDIAHLKGLFGETGIKKLWNIKKDIDDILYNAQKYILKDFRCCLLPPEGLMNPELFGQAYVTDQWFDYFKQTRNIKEKNWKDYKDLFLYPIEDIIESTLPGIKSKDKKNILKKVEEILEESRKMDEVDFEIKKKDLCIKLKDALNVDFLIGETERSRDDRQFIAAMFLLFPGNSKIYDEMLKEFDKIK